MRRVLQVRGQAEMQGARVDVESSERCGEAGRHKLVVLKPVRGAVRCEIKIKTGESLTYRFRVVNEGVVLVVTISDIYQVLNPIYFLGFGTLQRQTTKFSLLLKFLKKASISCFLTYFSFSFFTRAAVSSFSLLSSSSLLGETLSSVPLH